ncbi:hypothetical protein SAMN02745221_00318 [Thermosyntropha lipolytica DSM 11003]|uniref:Uncharacterized protein n=1 Tax=Thermosyntropha lipolytica DSM 11003 TaxID=1123382 RepID=A0A1M5K7G0_9FIRM|nr:hypothetical protein [Thermosyntropha lipolytica]SHG48778.1 hypothetical protein SAMN02745221_00318 [Thermosyntropha lipolytica DSM 11003]
MRTLVATALYNSKGREIYCITPKVTADQLKTLRSLSREQLEDAGFTFINIISPEFHNIKGHAIFFEGHLDEMGKVLKSLKRGV